MHSILSWQDENLVHNFLGKDSVTYFNKGCFLKILTLAKDVSWRIPLTWNSFVKSYYFFADTSNFFAEMSIFLLTHLLTVPLKKKKCLLLFNSPLHRLCLFFFFPGKEFAMYLRWGFTLSPEKKSVTETGHSKVSCPLSICKVAGS